MPIEVTESGTMVTGAEIDVYRVLVVRRALKIECETGMVMSRGASPMNAAKEICGSPKRTKRGVYADLDAFMVSHGFDSVPLRAK